MDVALAKKVSVDLVKVHLMQIPDIQQLVEEIWKSTGVMDSERTLCDHHEFLENHNEWHPTIL
jgi:hypothetical protein